MNLFFKYNKILSLKVLKIIAFAFYKFSGKALEKLNPFCIHTYKPQNSHLTDRRI